MNELWCEERKGPSIIPTLKPCCDDIQKYLIIWSHYTVQGAHGGAVGSGTALLGGRMRIRFPMVSMEFFVDLILQAALWPWGRLSL